MFTMHIRTRNAAFEGDAHPLEVARILHEVADKLEAGYRSGTARDYNGHAVGAFKLTGGPRR